MLRASANTSGASIVSQPSQIERQLREDWDNRECIAIVSHHIKKITDFLNQFGKCISQLRLLELYVADLTARGKLAQLNEQLTTLERRVEFLEARITRGETLN